MRIISNFKDYYDGVARMGFDKAIVYKRMTEKVKAIPSIEYMIDQKNNEDGQKYSRMFVGSISQHTDLTVNFLGFCGRYYPVYTVNKSAPEDAEAKYKYAHTCDIEKVPEIVAKVCIEEYKPIPGASKTTTAAEIVRNFMKHWIGEKPEYWERSSKSQALKVAEKIKKFPDTDPFFQLETPVFLVCGREIIKNPCLKDLGFMGILDPYQTFQEISMFVGGVMAQKHQMPCLVTDDDMIRDTHGFDENSFRNMTPGRKKNRAKNKLRKLKQRGS